MFEKAFLPFALDVNKDLTRDPIDCCIKEKIQSVIEVFELFFINQIQYSLYNRKFLTMKLMLFLIMIFGQIGDQR